MCRCLHIANRRFKSSSSSSWNIYYNTNIKTGTKIPIYMVKESFMAGRRQLIIWSIPFPLLFTSLHSILLQVIIDENNDFIRKKRRLYLVMLTQKIKK
ncbi:hypothetical protein BLOT_013208 [Blomia tropicalis]|nr:hypothetical protein BLOT_013208 [Blomia tropicalis]